MPLLRPFAWSLLLALVLPASALAAAPPAAPKAKPAPSLHIHHVDILIGTQSPGGDTPFYFASPQGVRNMINLPGESPAMRISDVWYEPLSDLTVVPQFRTINFGIEPGGQILTGSFRSVGPKTSPLLVRVFYSYYE